jgi:hypothetical protein
MRQTARRPLPPFRVYLCETSDKIARVSGIDARSDADARRLPCRYSRTKPPIPTLRFGSGLGSFVRCVGANKRLMADPASSGIGKTEVRTSCPLP